MNQQRARRLKSTGRSHAGRRAFAVAGALALTMALLTGCGSNGTPEETTENNAAPEQNAAASENNDARTSAATQVSPAAAQPTASDRRANPGEKTTADGQFAQDTQAPPIAFEPASLDFGIIKPGEEHTGTVQIRNVGAQPLRIVASRSSCKCTAVDLANVVIPPGESAPLTATMDSEDAPGPKKAQVRIAFEGFGQVATVDITAEVAMAVRCDPAYLAATENLQGTMTVSSLDGEPFRILASDRAEPDYVGFDPATDTPKDAYVVRWDLTKYDPDNCDEWPGWWVIETDHPEAAVVDMRIRHWCTVPKQPGTRRWFTTSQRALLGRVPPGETQEIEVEMLWAPAATQHDRQDHVIVAASRSRDFDVELVNVDYTLEDPTMTLRVTPDENLRGLLFGVIELHSLHGHLAEYTVIGRIEEDAQASIGP